MLTGIVTTPIFFPDRIERAYAAVEQARQDYASAPWVEPRPFRPLAPKDVALNALRSAEWEYECVRALGGIDDERIGARIDRGSRGVVEFVGEIVEWERWGNEEITLTLRTFEDCHCGRRCCSGEEMVMREVRMSEILWVESPTGEVTAPIGAEDDCEGF